MSDLQTPRLVLRAIDVAEGERIVSRKAGKMDVWAQDYPFDGDVAAVSMFLRASATDGEQRPFGYYQISLQSDGRAIGGIGFKGQPLDGRVEIGYGLAPSARGHGYAAEAIAAILTVAKDQGLLEVIADTTRDNVASQRSLQRAGFDLTSADADRWLFVARVK